MLYNPEWSEPKPEPLSVAGLAAWLRTQDPKETFRCADAADCVLVRYFKSIGYDVIVGGVNGKFTYWKKTEKKYLFGLIRSSSTKMAQERYPEDMDRVSWQFPEHGNTSSYQHVLDRCHWNLAEKSMEAA